MTANALCVAHISHDLDMGYGRRDAVLQGESLQLIAQARKREAAEAHQVPTRGPYGSHDVAGHAWPYIILSLAQATIVHHIMRDDIVY